MNKWIWIGFGLMWISVGLAVSLAVYITSSAVPLWALIIPATVKCESSKK